MKKIYIFVSCIILSIVLWYSTNAYATSEKTKIFVEDVTAKVTDETIEVPVKIESNSGVCGATLTVDYDENLELKGITKGNALSSLTMTLPGDLSQKTINILWDGVEEDKTNGTLFILKFRNPEKAGTYKVNILYKKGDIINGDLNTVDVDVVNGSIKIEKTTESTTETKPTTTTTETKPTTTTTETKPTTTTTETKPTTTTTETKPTTEEKKDVCAIYGHKGGEATCVKKAICEVCGKEYGSLDKSNHKNTEYRGYKACSCAKFGYSGDEYCSDCGAFISKGFHTEPYPHEWSSKWKVTKQPTALATGKKQTYCVECNKKKEQTIAKLKPTIKLSATKKTIKRKKTYTLTISKLAKADYVKSVTVNNKKLATVKKTGKNKYKITAKNKKGKVNITVTLASKKKATCQITVK